MVIARDRIRKIASYYGQKTNSRVQAGIKNAKPTCVSGGKIGGGRKKAYGLAWFT